MMQAATYAAAALVFAIGLYGVISNHDMIKICVSLSVMESSLVLVLVALAFREGGAAPIMDTDAVRYVDPLPHALSLTAIVIGAGIISLALGLTVMVYRQYGTTDIRRVFGSLR
ncbi:MAG: sodium:proton antiporter [Spirochaetaceae bacterium]|nr:MAG: sodium:proton antiporter [Spirochaetaceae bacterium]